MILTHNLTIVVDLSSNAHSIGELVPRAPLILSLKVLLLLLFGQFLALALLIQLSHALLILKIILLLLVGEQLVVSVVAEEDADGIEAEKLG